MIKINSKLPKTGTTIFTVMSQLANEYQAINLSQGFPNFPIALKLEEKISDVVKNNNHQYVPLAGYPPLMNAVQKKVFLHYNRKIEPNKELLITAGATQAIYTAIAALIAKNDEVIVLDPSYDCYAPSVILAGGKPVHINMNSDYSVNWNEVEKAFNEKTKMLIVNNPHNPSGSVFSEKDILAIEEILEKYPNVFLLSDEVYEFIHFEEPHISFHTREKLRNRLIVTSSFGKTFHVTGWKIGYVIAPEFVMKEFKKVHQYVVFCVNSISQIALADYLEETDLNLLGPFYQAKRDLFLELMKDSKFEFLPSKGSYFVTATYNRISDLGDFEFAQWLTKEIGVAVIPTSVFYADGIDRKQIRFCFAKEDETLKKAAKLLCKI